LWGVPPKVIRIAKPSSDLHTPFSDIVDGNVKRVMGLIFTLIQKLKAAGKTKESGKCSFIS